MKQLYDITPPPELVKQWASEFYGTTIAPRGAAIYVATKAARWGADQELEACCDHLRDYQWGFIDRPDGTKMHRAVDLELARRPKPPSLKQQALAALEDDEIDVYLIRRALEALDD
jgi:hypothetical protein